MIVTDGNQGILAELSDAAMGGIAGGVVGSLGTKYTMLKADGPKSGQSVLLPDARDDQPG